MLAGVGGMADVPRKGEEDAEGIGGAGDVVLGGVGRTAKVSVACAVKVRTDEVWADNVWADEVWADKVRVVDVRAVRVCADRTVEPWAVVANVEAWAVVAKVRRLCLLLQRTGLLRRGWDGERLGTGVFSIAFLKGAVWASMTSFWKRPPRRPPPSGRLLLFCRCVVSCRRPAAGGGGEVSRAVEGRGAAGAGLLKRALNGGGGGGAEGVELDRRRRLRRG